MATVASIDFSGGGLKNSDIATGAALAANKLIHQKTIATELFSPTTTIAALAGELLFIASASGTLQSFEGIVITNPTGADRTVTVDLERSTGGGGFASILSTNIEIVDGTADLTPVVAVISNTTVADGDIYKVVVTVAGSAGNQALGLLVTLVWNEQPI